MSTSQSSPAWKKEINAKLHEHRSRRKVPTDHQGRLAEMEPSFAANPRQPAASRVAARVAERYAKAPSYREMLERQAAHTPARLISPQPQSGPQQAPAGRPESSFFEAAPANPTPATEIPAPETAALETAAPEIAAPEAPAPRLAGQQAPERSSPEPTTGNTTSLNRWAEFDPSPIPEFSGPAPAPEPAEVAAPAPDESVPGIAQPPSPQNEAAGQDDDSPLFEEESPASVASLREPPDLPISNLKFRQDTGTLSLLRELATQPIEPAQPLPARIIEFPRELVAPRKARPRREHGYFHTEDHQSQLRIFEAGPEADGAVSIQPGSEIALPAHSQVALAHCNAIRLDEDSEASANAFLEKVGLAEPSTSLLLDPPIYTAGIEDRLMAGIVDLCLTGLGFMLFVAAFAASTPHLPTGKFALAAAAGAFLAFFVLYQYLFLTCAGGTPGMRYANIALCAFDDDNPAPKSIRARIPAILLSALPLGLGFLWSLFDEDRLGWHDRITRTYQRSYREN